MKSNAKKLIFIYGAPAVGKLTVAKEIEKNTGYKVLHNHDIIDLVQRFWDRGADERSFVRCELAFLMLNLFLSKGARIIMTHAYASNFVFRFGLSDTEFVDNIKNICKKNGFEFCPVHLVADEQEIFKRSKNPSRKSFSKLKNLKKLRELLKKEDFVTPYKDKNGISINNTKITPKKVASMIINHYKIK